MRRQQKEKRGLRERKHTNALEKSKTETTCIFRRNEDREDGERLIGAGTAGLGKGSWKHEERRQKLGRRERLEGKAAWAEWGDVGAERALWGEMARCFGR